jgi:TPR repeat protein
MSAETGRLLCLLATTGANPTINRSLLSASTFAVHNSNSASPDQPLLLGLCSTNVMSQIHCFRIAASRGSVTAMALIGRCYRTLASLSVSNPPSSARPHLEMAIRWFLRAHRNGSIDALQDLATTYAELHDLPRAIHYFILHLDRTKSLFSLAEIALGLAKWGLTNSAFAWMHLGVASGAVRTARVLAKGNSSWADCVKKFNVLECPETAASPPKALRAILTQNLSVPPPPSCSRGPLGGRTRAFVAPPARSGREEFVPSATYMVKSKSELMRLAFRAASPVWAKRDLGLCGQLLQKLGGWASVTNSILFRNRAAYGNGSQLTKCGFIAALLGDREYALALFQRASDAGNLTGTLMAGLVLFHGVGIERDTTKACFMLAKCMIDPIALLHLGVATEESVWLDRAAALMNTKSSEMTWLFEVVGDLFFDGVKLPRDLRIASLWYGYAAKQAEIEAADTAGIIAKLSKFV